MKKHIEMTNKFLADIAVLNIKFYNLHWNVTGMNFVALHEFTEGLYEAFEESFDTVAEHIRMAGEYPFGSLKEYLANTQIEERADEAICGHGLVQICFDDLSTMRKSAIAIRKEADEAGAFTTVALFEDLVAQYDKNLWMLGEMIKHHDKHNHNHEDAHHDKDCCKH